jgi:4-hydroxy-tetrahydrodipicolinate synthase
MQDMKLQGIFVAITTAMHPDESLNLDYLQRKVRYLENAGIHGIFALGTNGELHALEKKEKIILLETLRKLIGKEIVLCANIGTTTTRESIELAKTAQKIGVDAVAIISPYFIDLSEDELHYHFSSIADAVDIPVLLYNIPSRTGNVISCALVERLYQSGSIAGVKESSGDIKKIKALTSRAGSGLKVFCGTDSLVLPGLRAGCVGSVSGLANVLPELVVGIYRYHKDGYLEKAEDLQKHLSEFRELFQLGSASTITKLAENLQGNLVGPSRLPAGCFGENVKEEVKKALETVAPVISNLKAGITTLEKGGTDV